MAEKNVKKRNWAFLVYPESAPENWLQILQATGLQCAISPLHDRDLNATGEPKRPTGTLSYVTVAPPLSTL